MARGALVGVVIAAVVGLAGYFGAKGRDHSDLAGSITVVRKHPTSQLPITAPLSAQRVRQAFKAAGLEVKLSVVPAPDLSGLDRESQRFFRDSNPVAVLEPTAVLSNDELLDVLLFRRRQPSSITRQPTTAPPDVAKQLRAAQKAAEKAFFARNPLIAAMFHAAERQGQLQEYQLEPLRVPTRGHRGGQILIANVLIVYNVNPALARKVRAAITTLRGSIKALGAHRGTPLGRGSSRRGVGA